MNKILCGFFMVFLLLFLAIPISGETNSDSPGIPCLDDWTVINRTIINVEASSSVTVYLGFEIEYQNPNNPKEFVRVVRRIVPLVSVRYIKKTSDSQKDLDVSSFFVKKEEYDMVEKDLRTGTYIQLGNSEIWILNSDSDCWYFSRNEKVSVKFLSAYIPGVKRNAAIIGREYSVDKDHYQILSIGPNELKLVGKKLNPKSKKGADNEK
jgi:hypothetical protein